MKIKRFFLSLVSIFTLLLALPLATRAAEIRTDDLTVDETEIVNDDLYLFGDEISVDGLVEGDLVMMGGTVDFTGSVTGNLIVSGGMVDLRGEVDGTLYVWGGQVEISTVVGRDIVAAGGQVRVTADAQVEEDINVAGGQIYINAPVGDDVRVGAGTADISDEVGGDVLASGGMVTVEEDLVSGEVSINEDYGLDIDAAEIRQELVDVGAWAVTFGVIAKIGTFIGMLLVGMVMLWLAPVKSKMLAEKISSSWKEFLNSLLIGFVAFLPVVVGPFVLLITVLGVPLAFLLFGFMLFMTVFGVIWGDIAVGRAVARELKWKDKRYYASLFTGRVIRLLFGWVPVIGGLYKFVIFLATLGAIVRMKSDLLKKK